MSGISYDAEDREEEKQAKSSLISKNVTINKHRTSIRLEPEMWQALREICRREKCTAHELCTLIYNHKSSDTSLTAAIRVFLMLYYKAASTEEGHINAGHGSIENMRRRCRHCAPATQDNEPIRVQRVPNYRHGSIHNETIREERI